MQFLLRYLMKPMHDVTQAIKNISAREFKGSLETFHFLILRNHFYQELRIHTLACAMPT